MALGTVLELSRDPVGIQEVLDGQDAHALNQKAFNLPSRLIAKKYLFRTIFNHGKGYAFTLDPEFMHVSTSIKYWDTVGEKFYTKYAGIEQLYQKNMRIVASGRPLIGPLGRFWPLEMEMDWKGELELPETKLVNYPVQGTSADVMTIARISFWNRLKKKPYFKHVKMVATVHDSIVCDSKELSQEVVNLYHQVFDDIPANIKKLFGYYWVVPLGCECCVGPNFKDQEEIKRTDMH